ncbi:MAG: hypothetical protein ACTHNS_12780 [Marmoricola sp.]
MNRFVTFVLTALLAVAGLDVVAAPAMAHTSPGRVTARFSATPAPTCSVKVGRPGGRRTTVRTFPGWQRRMVVVVPEMAARRAHRKVYFFACGKQVERRVVPAGRRARLGQLRITFRPLLPGEDNLRNFRDGSNVAAHPGPEEQLGGGRYSNATIADIGLSKVGQNLYTPGPIDHGQCKQAVNDWIYQASGHTQSTAPGYYRAYASQGGELVSRDEAVKGDIIQTYSAADGGTGYHSGMHTMVVVSHQSGSNTFDVVDSNSVASDTVGHHLYDPYAKAARWGLSVAIWRMGSVDAPAAPAASPQPPPSTSNPTPPPTPSAATYTETAGSSVHTWTNYTNAGGAEGATIAKGQAVQIACKLPGFRVSDGNTWWYRVESSPWNDAYYASADGFYNNGATAGSLSGTPYVDPTVPDCGSGAGPGGDGGATGARETTGSVARTWTNYSNAGGTEGPQIGSNQTVTIACVVQGFRVADGNTNWYRIASAPWSGQYYVSADAFYNNGATSGSLHGTPFVDPAVPAC